MTATPPKIPFTKMHGCGNDFVVLHEDKLPRSGFPGSLARAICHRRFGIGADGVLLLRRDPTCDAGLTIYNADGSTAEMCGNGLRVVARWLWQRDPYAGREAWTIRIGHRVHTVTGTFRDGEMISSRVSMGVPELIRERETLEVPSDIVHHPIEFDRVDVGNPHAVLFPETIEDATVRRLGPALERHPAFPGGTNVGFVQVLSRSQLVMRVWERGVGETLACGSGAVAAVLAAHRRGWVDREVKARLPGGTLMVHIGESGNASLSGGAVTVARGVFDASSVSAVPSLTTTAPDATTNDLGDPVSVSE